MDRRGKNRGPKGLLSIWVVVWRDGFLYDEKDEISDEKG
jgi:hypothetical protein